MAFDFSRGVDAGFSTAVHGRAATYTPSGGQSASVTVILEKARRANRGMLQPGFRANARSALVRASDVAAPANGAALSVTGESESYTVTGYEAVDPRGLVWRLMLQVAS